MATEEPKEKTIQEEIEAAEAEAIDAIVISEKFDHLIGKIRKKPINKKNKSGNTLLHLADAAQNNEAIALPAKKPSVDISTGSRNETINFDNWFSKNYLQSKNHPESVTRNPAPKPSPPPKMSPQFLIEAMDKGIESEKETLELFKEHETDLKIIINKRCLYKEQGARLLAIALYNGLRAVPLYLLTLGADPNSIIEKISHQTALHLAAKNGDIKTVQLLLEKGASTNAIDTHDETPLHLVSRELGEAVKNKNKTSRKNYEDIFRLLLKYGGGLTEKNRRELTPIGCFQSKVKKRDTNKDIQEFIVWVNSINKNAIDASSISSIPPAHTSFFPNPSTITGKKRIDDRPPPSTEADAKKPRLEERPSKKL